MALRDAAKTRASTPKAATPTSKPATTSEKARERRATPSASLRGKAKSRPKSKGSEFKAFGAEEHAKFLEEGKKEKEDMGPVLPYSPDAVDSPAPPSKLGWISSYANIPSLRRKGLNSGF